MSKQTRLNFGQASSTSSKRRRLNSSETSTVDEDNKIKESPKFSSNTEATDELPSLESKGSNNTDPKTPNPTSHHQNLHQKPSPNQKLLTLTNHKADLFAAPPNTLICHATNAQGTWGAGIAAAFKKHYPAAFKLYASHCAKWTTSSLLGTTYLIPPQEKSSSKSEREARHWIGCLFTSEKKGKGKGSKESILEATGDAVADLARRVRDVNDDAAAGAGPKGIPRPAIASVRMCKINSGLFGVPWEATRAVVEGIEVGEGGLEEIEVFSMT